MGSKPSLLPAWPLLPSPRLRLIPTTWADTDSATMESDTPDSDTVDSDTPDSDTMDSDTESTARGRPRLSLRPSLRLLLVPTTPTDTDSDTMDLDMPDSDTVDSDMPDSDHGLGYRVYGKREAEAEPEAAADPYYGYGYSGLGYAGYRHGYYGHGYGHGYYGWGR